MPKYSNARILNFSYNHDSRKIKDVSFPFDNQHTLIHAENGIGKTLTCRLLSIPFTCTVKKNSSLYKLVGFDFDNIITEKNGPTYACLELSLDGESNGYLLLVVGLEKIPEKDKVIKTVFATTYNDTNSELSIKNFPFYDETGKLKKVKTLCESLRSKSRVRIFGEYTNSSMAQYVDLLAEYNISIDEKLLALKAIGGEGGLTDIFKNETTTDKFFSEHLMPLITRHALVHKESEENAFDGLRDSVVTNAIDKQKHKSKMDALKEYRMFSSDLMPIKADVEIIEKYQKEMQTNHMHFLRMISILREMREEFVKKLEDCEKQIRECKINIRQVKIDEINYNITDAKEKIKNLTIEQEGLIEQKERLEQIVKEIQRRIYAYDCKTILGEIDTLKGKINALNDKKANFNNSEKEHLRINDLGGMLLRFYTDELLKIESKLTEIKKSKSQNITLLTDTRAGIREYGEVRVKIEKELTRIQTSIDSFKEYSNQLCNSYSEYNFPTFIEVCIKNGIDSFANEINVETEKIQKEIAQLNAKIKEITEDLVKLKNQSEELKHQKAEKESEFDEKCTRRKNIKNSLDKINNLLNRCHMTTVDIESVFDAAEIVGRRINQENDFVFEAKTTMKAKQNLLNNLKNHKQDIDPALKSILEDNSIDYKYGYSMLQEFSEEKRDIVLKRIPLLPYAVIVNENKLAYLEKYQSSLLSSFCTPILSYKQINDIIEINNGENIDFKNTHVYVSIPVDFHQDDFIENAIKKTGSEIDELSCIINVQENLIDNLKTIKNLINELSLICDTNTLMDLDTQIAALQDEINKMQNDIVTISDTIMQNEADIKNANNSITELNKKLSDVEKLCKKLLDYKERFAKYQAYCKQQTDLDTELNNTRSNIQKLQTREQELQNELEYLSHDENLYSVQMAKYTKDKVVYAIYEDYIHESVCEGFNLEIATAEFNEKKANADATLQSIENQLTNLCAELMNKEDSFRNKLDTAALYGVTEQDCRNAEIIDEAYESTICETHKKELDKINQSLGGVRASLSSEMKREKNNETKLLNDFGEVFNPLYSSYNFENETERLHAELNVLEKEHVRIGENINKINDFLESRTKSNDKQAPATYPFPYTITTDNFKTVASEVEKKWKASNYNHQAQIEQLSQKLDKILIKYQDKNIVTKINELKMGIKELTLAKIEILITRCNKYIETIEKEVEFIQKNHAQIMAESKSFAQKLWDALQQFDSVANQIKFSDGTKAVEFKNLKSESKLRPSLENVEDYVNMLIDHCTTLDETEIKQYVSKHLTEEQLLRQYIDVSQVKLMVAKKDKNAFWLTPYEDVIADKVSGAQKLLASFSLLLLICKYQSLEYNHKYATPLIQDNPFGTSSTDYFVDAMFDLADACNVQLISFTALESEHIFKKHPVFLKYVLNKTKGNKEIITVNTGNAQDEIISLFHSNLTYEDI